MKKTYIKVYTKISSRNMSW